MEKEVTRPSVGVMQLVIVAIVAAIVTVTAILSSFVTFVPGISFFYIPLGLEVAFGAWFGIWGVIGSWIGAFLYNPFYGIPILYGAVTGISDSIGAWMGLIAFKLLRADPSLRKPKDWIICIVICLVIANPLEALVYGLALVPLGWYTVEYAIGEGWIIMTMMDWIPFATQFPVLLILSPFIKKTPLYIDGWY